MDKCVCVWSILNALQVNESMWELGDALCDTWVALDVGCCTASILNLAAISVDRSVNAL